MPSAYEAYCRSYQSIMRLAVQFLDWTEPTVLNGKGAIADLADLIQKKGYKKILFVTDEGLQKLHLPDTLLELLKERNIEVFVYDKVKPNPSIASIEEARTMYADNGCEAIIAMGGGSVMDCAKAAGARIACPNKSVAQMRGELKVGRKIPMLFAIPTTAGTGSETTIAAVVSNPETHEKFSINDPHLRPKYAVLDPELTVGLPGKITSTTGMDALTHAVEAYIGQSNTKDTERAAKDAVRLIFSNLETAYNEPQNLQARSNMLLASYYAGLAFTRAYVGYCHAIAHALGGMYGVPHGLANAVILPVMLDWFKESAWHRLAELADAAGMRDCGISDEEKARAFIEEIRRMNRNMQIPSTIKEIQDEDMDLIAERAMHEGNPLYPVPKIMNKEECKEVLKILKG